VTWRYYSGARLIADDEMVEVAPAAIRLRKRLLKEVDRKRAARRG